MAQENSPDKEKRQGRTKKPEKPYVEQIDELLLVHNKNDPKEGLGVVSKADEKGNYQTVTPEEKNSLNRYHRWKLPHRGANSRNRNASRHPRTATTRI